MKLYLRGLGLVFFLTVAASAQEPKQTSQSPARTVVIDIDVIDVNLDQRSEIEKIINDKRSLERLVVDGKARPIAGIQVRARSGEQATARIGQRVPVQASTTTQGTAQIQYENTGLNVDVQPRILESRRLEIKLHLELTAVVRNENPLAPTFVQRAISDVVSVLAGEPVLLLNVTQHEGLLPPAPNTRSRPGAQVGGDFVVVLNARILD